MSALPSSEEIRELIRSEYDLWADIKRTLERIDQAFQRQRQHSHRVIEDEDDLSYLMDEEDDF